MHVGLKRTGNGGLVLVIWMFVWRIGGVQVVHAVHVAQVAHVAQVENVVQDDQHNRSSCLARPGDQGAKMTGHLACKAV